VTNFITLREFVAPLVPGRSWECHQKKVDVDQKRTGHGLRRRTCLASQVAQARCPEISGVFFRPFRIVVPKRWWWCDGNQKCCMH